MTEQEWDDGNQFEPKPLLDAPLIWTKPSVSGVGASARGGHSAILYKNELIIFGGQYFSGEFQYLNDVHSLDVETLTWHQPKVTGDIPEGRYGHSAHLVGDRMFIIGGRGKGGKLLRKVYFLDLVSMTWVQVDSTTDTPLGRQDHAACLVGRKIVIHGGWDGKKDFDDLWVLDTDTAAWIKPKVSGVPPSARHGHSIDLSPDGRLLVFGGYTIKVSGGAIPKYNADMRELDIESMIWSRSRTLGDYPCGRFAHSTTTFDDRVFIYGGWTGLSRCRLCNVVLPQEGSKKDPASVHQPDCITGKSLVGAEKLNPGPSQFLKVLDTKTMQWSSPQQKGAIPETRYGHTMTQVGLHLLIFGGWDGNGSRALSEFIALQVAEL